MVKLDRFSYTFGGLKAEGKDNIAYYSIQVLYIFDRIKITRKIGLLMKKLTAMPFQLRNIVQ